MATIKGKWVFNEVLNFSVSFSQTFTIPFISNSNSYVKMWHGDSDEFNLCYLDAETSWSVYNPNTSFWVNEKYRTVDFGKTEQEVSDEFYTWFTANAKQIVTFDLSTLDLPSGTYNITAKAKADGYEDSNESEAVEYVVESATSLISFTVNGTSYQAEEGMTWKQWCDSDYNTVGAYQLLGNGVETIRWSGDAPYFKAVAKEDDNGNGSDVLVVYTDTIIKGTTYYTISVTHSGGAA